ncbi:MAG TPA: S28 family serine protease [Polyangium sp.]|nr:S28 family serine protease [Polyangium sp.]
MLRKGMFFLLCTQLLACTEDEPQTQPDLDILERLQAVAGLGVAESTSPIEGYRYFVMDFDQPGDHNAPDSTPHFKQRVLLLHRDENAPMVLGTSGYFVNPAKPRIREPAQLLEGNQLWVEQRFFAPSRPEPADWSWLTIEQAATDHHRLVEALRPIYSAKWISSGASKGGMTSVYHRRFFPNDVDGTVAYVAPHSFGSADPRYLDFVAQVGDADCRTKLVDFQRELLMRRTAMIDLQTAAATAQNDAFDVLGADKAFESAVVEFFFTFWQYADATRCPDIPNAAATDQQVWAFFDEICSPLNWSDSQVLGYEPYFWQAALELGYPAYSESNIADLLQYPGFDVASSYVLPGPGKTPTFNAEAMNDISNWLDAEGERILFVYGENDPYSAAAFDIGAAKDTFKFFAPGENHSALILDLVETDRSVAFDALERWTGKAPVVPTGQALEIRESRRERW